MGVLIGLQGCAGTPAGQVLVRVGATPIGKPSLTHWMQVLASEHETPAGELRERALEFLISAAWLTGEGARLHLLSAGAAEQGLKARLASYPGGAKEALELTGRTIADLELEVEADLASRRIRQMLAEREPGIAPEEVVVYYHGHPSNFRTPEERYFDIDSLPSDARARQIKREVESGRSFASVALEEKRSDPPGAKDALERAIFSARPNVLSGPILLKGHYHSIFELKRIVPNVQRSLAQTRNTIVQRLAAAQRRRMLARFTVTWRARWRAMTDCEQGFVVWGCAQYRGSVPREDPLEIR